MNEKKDKNCQNCSCDKTQKNENIKNCSQEICQEDTCEKGECQTNNCSKETCEQENGQKVNCPKGNCAQGSCQEDNCEKGECQTNNCPKGTCEQEDSCENNFCCKDNNKCLFNKNKDDQKCTNDCSESVNNKEEIEKLKIEKKQLQENLLEITKKYDNEKLKYQADLDNFQKRIQKEKIHSLKYASMNLITEMLAPLEQLEKALEMTTEEPLLKNFLLGFKMIFKQTKDILKKDGVQEIKALGEKFNPEFHHAIEKISDKNKPNGINLAVIEKGFLYKDLVIKPAMVKINEWSDNSNENK
ncbi:MAG: nucleotide exchange factor GrpE [Candidatus Phytoplasma vitis]|nr:MAG: nucleotide exchange factor GrpE [Candidatus Phytoplasma vitis]